MRKVILILSVLSTLFISSSPADARRRLICGEVMRHLTGGHLGPAFNRALHWLVLDRISAGPGAVVVQHRKGRDSAGGPGGHVSLIRSMKDRCTAIVSDDRGTYPRDICKNGAVYVNPHGNVAVDTVAGGKPPRHKKNASVAFSGHLNGIIIRTEYF